MSKGWEARNPEARRAYTAVKQALEREQRVHQVRMRRALAAWCEAKADQLDNYGNPYVPHWLRQQAREMGGKE